MSAADVLMIVGGVLGAGLGFYLVARFDTIRRIDLLVRRGCFFFLILFFIVAAVAGVIGMVLAS